MKISLTIVKKSKKYVKSDFYCFLYLNTIIEFGNISYIHRTDFHFNFKNKRPSFAFQYDGLSVSEFYNIIGCAV